MTPAYSDEADEPKPGDRWRSGEPSQGTKGNGSAKHAPGAGAGLA